MAPPTDPHGQIVMAGLIFGVRVHELASEEDLRRVCERFLGGDRASRIFTPNPEILLRARSDPSYAELLNSADLALPDGAGVAIVTSFRARRRVRRWPGTEIGGMLLRLAAARDAPVVFVGGGPGVADRAAERWRMRVPDLRIDVVGAGSPVGDDGVSRPADRDGELIRLIRSAAPAIVLVGLGAPKQERWIERHVADLPSVRVVMGIGGAFDMWAGRLPRAPRFLRRVGLEWAWRLGLEPHRLPRIVRAAVVFPLRALMDRAD
jgi:N-acetylglucosaminyldiphosphoundecaprenol N-acetyl-beta-D-mannosaminyltransferase